MTISEIKQDLFNWFVNHDSFSLDTDFDELYVLIAKKDQPFQKSLIKKAMEGYVAQNIVVPIEAHGKEMLWVLTKPLEQYSQTIELTFPTILNLSKLINEYCDSVKNKESKVDPLNITESAIQDLIVITHGVLTGVAE